MLQKSGSPLRVAVIGAGIAGLSAAVELSAGGCAVTVLERAATVGGKMRRIPCSGARVADGGPTVLTLAHVFERLFSLLGTRLDEHLTLQPLSILARHAWCDGGHLDLHADPAQSAAAIRDLSGPADAAGYLRFCEHSRQIFQTLDRSFMQQPAPSLTGLIAHAGLQGLPGLLQIQPFVSLWRQLGTYFRDPRLRQLFARYATYCGSSPFDAPATLMLVAHVEQAGVWRVEGGMHRLPDAIRELLEQRQVEIRCGSEVVAIDSGNSGFTALQLADGTRLAADAVVATCDAAAIATGEFGIAASKAASPVPLARRSLSAMTWVGSARADGFALDHHNVFFSDDYRDEFDSLIRRRQMPERPTVYICAQDRPDDGHKSIPPAGTDGERLLCLINAPPTGDTDPFDEPEVARCLNAMHSTLERCGLRLSPASQTPLCTTPRGFHALFPGSGGALYGPASHGWRASFQRAGVRTRVRGLYLAGGSVHPGPGLPMAALSGRQAANCLMQDFASTCRFPPMGIDGGTSTR